jgi:adenylate kinase family enzyme
MKRVVVLGRGGAGKSTASMRLGQLTGLPVIELDKLFWLPGMAAMPVDDWLQAQRALAAAGEWIMDGDLGPYDAPAPRLGRADTVLILDFSLLRCAWRAARRSREQADFWWWLLIWRRHSRPTVLEAVARYSPNADLHVLRTPRALRHFLTTVDGQT